MVRTETDHPMLYTITDKGNGYWVVHFRGMFCMTSRELEACAQYIKLQGGVTREGEA